MPSLPAASTPRPPAHHVPVIAALVLALLAVVPRFTQLDLKPAMHDESMFAFYAWQGIQAGKHYIHQPILHGPVQMLGIGWFFRMFGDSLGSARMFIACCSLAMLAAGLWLLPRRLRWQLAPLWITSPIILYYSRYLHEELIFNGAYLLGMLGAARAFRRNWQGTLGLLLGLMALMLLVARPGAAGGFMAALMLAGAMMCGGLGLRCGAAAGAWGALASIGLLFPLAVKENALFVYAAGFTFLLAWAAIGQFWQRPAPGLSWLPEPAGRPRPPARAKATAKNESAAARKKQDESAPPKRGQKYMHRPFEEVVNGKATAEGAANGPAEGGANAGETLPRPPCPGKSRAWQLLLWGLGLALGIAIVVWVYGSTRDESQPNWGPLQLLKGAQLNMRGSWDYWLEQHELHRIDGAIDYYVPILLLYELPALLLLALGLAWDATRRRGRLAFYLTAMAAWLLIFWLWGALSPHMGPESLLKKGEKFLHVTPNAQMLEVGLIITPLLAWSVLCLKQRLPLAAWMGWWAACSLFQYSSAGEKVPWLAVNIIVPFYLALGWVWAPHAKRLPRWGKWTLAGIALAGTLIAARNDYYLVRVPAQDQSVNNYRYAADPRERIVYNHTPLEFDRLCRNMIESWKLDEARRPLSERRVLLNGNPGWPGVWYFRHCAYMLGGSTLNSLDPGYDLIISDQTLAEPALKDIDLTQWTPRQLSLRNHWMVVWPDENCWARWWTYYWTREIWPPEPVVWPVTAIYPANRR